MNTEDLMDIAINMAEIKNEIPADSAIYHSGSSIQRILMGIDIGVAELKIAKDLDYDAVIAHHPQGALSTFHGIIYEHVEQMVAAGVPRTEAEKAVKDLQEKYILKSHTLNTDHVTSFAKLLDIPFLNIHYPLDQLGRKRMIKAIKNNTGEKNTVGDIIDALYTIDEFKEANTDIQLRLGNKENNAGKVVVSHGAGTNGGFEIARTYYENDIDTVIYIHVHQGDLKKLREWENSKNLIVTGHIVSDLIGINPYISRLEKEGLTVDRVSGL